MVFPGTDGGRTALKNRLQTIGASKTMSKNQDQKQEQRFTGPHFLENRTRFTLSVVVPLEFNEAGDPTRLFNRSIRPNDKLQVPADIAQAYSKIAKDRVKAGELVIRKAG